MRNSSPRTIMVVEDEAPIRRLISRILSLEDYRVMEAGHGEEALAVSEGFDGEIHLLITDIMMPVMNGQELATRLSALRPGMAILFISGYPGKHVPGSLDDNPRVGYLAKPFNTEALLGKVGALLG